MDVVLLIVIMASLAAALVGWIWGMLVARKISVGYLVGVALVSIIAFPIMASKHWQVSKRPFLLYAVGMVALYIAAWVAAGQLAPNDA